MTKRIAIVGGGIAGVTAAWQLACLQAAGADVEAVLFEGSPRLGGILKTVRSGGFTVECGPDSWVTEKPWARELAEELGLSGEVISSNDSTRKTYVLVDGKLVAMPDGMRMMVPGDMAALDASTLFSDAAKAAYHDEILCADSLKANAPDHDESVAQFVERHFGREVLDKIGAPLLSGVFGGDVAKLSVRAVMAPFVAMERNYGSLILAVQQRANKPNHHAASIFTSLTSGLGTLVDTMLAAIPTDWIQLETPILKLYRAAASWQVETARGIDTFDAILLAVPVDVARQLIEPLDPDASNLMQMESSSAVVAAFGFTSSLDLPGGFGFLVPPGSSGSRLLAATFVDQKFNHRAPAGAHLLRAFFGGAAAERLLNARDEEIAALALRELQTILGELPAPVLTVVRSWPNSLPQYAVGHPDRMVELFKRIDNLGGLWLLGNGYRGVGLPDLIRDARSAAREAADLVQ